MFNCVLFSFSLQINMSFVLTMLILSYSSPIKTNHPTLKYLGLRNAEVEQRQEACPSFYLHEKFLQGKSGYIKHCTGETHRVELPGPMLTMTGERGVQLASEGRFWNIPRLLQRIPGEAGSKIPDNLMCDLQLHFRERPDDDHLCLQCLYSGR